MQNAKAGVNCTAFHYASSVAILVQQRKVSRSETAVDLRARCAEKL